MKKWESKLRKLFLIEATAGAYFNLGRASVRVFGSSDDAKSGNGVSVNAEVAVSVE